MNHERLDAQMLIQVHETTKRKLIALAEKQGRSLSNFVRRLCEQELGDDDGPTCMHNEH